MAGSDIRYPPPGPDHHALAGTFAPDLILHTDEGATSVADLMHTARPVLLDLTDRANHRRTHRDRSARAARSALRLVRHTSRKELMTCP
jgi:hypothetical protein